MTQMRKRETTNVVDRGSKQTQNKILIFNGYFDFFSYPLLELLFAVFSLVFAK